MNTDGLHLARQRIADCVQLDGSGVLIQRKEGLNLAGLGLTDEDLEGRFNPGERQLPEIGLQNLKRLRYLDLSGNRLTRLPVGVTSMAELRWLGLNFNALESLPDGLGVLSGLQRLYVRGNRLRHLPESIGLLPRLLELDLHGNALEALPSTFIKLLEREGTPGDSAVHLELGGNPLQAEAAAGAGRETLLAYLRALQQESGKPQGKLLLVGEGRVGKSSLLRALLGLPHDAALSTTHGLKIERWELAGAGGHGNPVQLNCWDFSGQQEMRETHQMFFTAPALYLLVWDPNRGQSESERQLFEWLWLIHQCQREGARARVLVVATFHRSRDRHEPDNKFDLLRDFGPDGAGILHGFVSVDSDDDSAGGGRYGISEVSKWVRNQIVEDATFTQSVPARWEEAVGECLGGRTPILRWEEFVGICRSHGRELPVEALGRTMNALGRLVWFEDESVLRDYVVLQPAWLGKAISYVFEKASSVPEVETRETPLGAGLVPTSAMDKIWTAPGTRDESGNPEPGYPAYLFPIFRRLMRKFDMIQPLGPAVATAARDGQGGEPQWYLVPARLAGKPETWDRDWSSRGTIALRLALKSRGWKPEASEADLNPWIAQGIFWRLIVRLHPQAQGRQSLANAAHWRRGLRLRDRSWGDARVHLERHCIYFEGSTHLSGWVLSALDQLLADVNQRFKTQVHYDEELACQPVSSEEAGTQIECAQGLDCRRYFSPERLRRWLEPGPQGRQVTVLECGQGTCDFQIDVRRTLGGLHFTAIP
ncbi:MAG: hypothetical protein KF791_12995 [Verrucomicrobiae bacterium]|nr:hypothetical protein [Verrucomicrobiae bacterium]